MNLPYILSCEQVALIGLPGPKVIIQLVASRHRMTPRQLCGERRDKETYLARNEAIRLVYTHTTVSVSRIGQLFHRNHSTILYSLGRLDKSPYTTLNRETFPAKSNHSQKNGDECASCMSSAANGHI